MGNKPELTGSTKYEVIMISTEDAWKMVEESMKAEDSQPKDSPETGTASAQTTVADDKKSDVVNSEPEPKAEGEPARGEGKELVGQPEDKTKSPDGKKTRRTHQARLDYSFKKLKDDIKAKEKRIEELEGLLKKTKELTKEDFNGNEREYQKHLVENALRERDLEDAKRQKDEAEGELAGVQFTSALSAKADSCFEGDDEARDHFERLMGNGYEKFCECVNARDPNGVVADFLDDSEYAPLVIRAMMTKPDILRRILDRRTANGMLRELQVLENNISIRRNIKRVQAKSAKAPLPKLGSMVKTAAKSEPEVFDDAWGANYLRNHRSGRF